MYNIYNKKNNLSVPIWLMRQAGRYLPEYMKIRKHNPDFIKLCYNSELASEITLQPIDRFNLDAAIIFSDILVILDALGCNISFKKNHGPIIETDLDKLISLNTGINLQEKITEKLSPIYEAIKLTRQNLKKEKSLIGFSGAFWTLFAYLIEGEGSKNFNKAKKYYYNNSDKFQKIEDIICESISIHLKNQINAGCDIIQIFDSWAGVLSSTLKHSLVIDPTKKILSSLKKNTKKPTIICFPRGIGYEYKSFAKLDFDILSLDYNFPIEKSFEIYKNYNKAIQGNLDPITLLANDKKIITTEVSRILKETKDIPFIFNLGHGILPETPIENIEYLIKLVKKK